MINPSEFCKFLKKNNIDFYVGVPDSLMKGFCNYLHVNIKNNYISANEGTALSFASGYYLKNKKIPCVYLQNSGLGNLINPLLSLCDKKVYKIPALIIVGWRGEPGVIDEPQHKSQGEVTLKLIKSLKKKFLILSKDLKKNEKKLTHLINHSKQNLEPVFIIVKKKTFLEFKLFKKKKIKNTEIVREKAIKLITNNVDKNSRFVSTTGMTSRELLSLRENGNNESYKDFYVVGSMGHTSQIALGISINNTKQIICLDGDGAALMHLGSLAMIGSLKKKINFLHILFNNFCHESVGGQSTCSSRISFPKIAKACGYDIVFSEIKTYKELTKIMKKLKRYKKKKIFLEIYIKNFHRQDIGRPTKELTFYKKNFINNI